MANILEVNNLTVAYGSKNVVKNCSFELAQGEIAVVLGASGEGKTTLLRALCGLLPHGKGSVTFKGEKVKDVSEKLVPGHQDIKMVDQDFGLDIHHNVEENVRLRLLRFDKTYQSQRIAQLLRLTKLTKYKAYKATHISGGQQQRLAIARALADEPELLLLDEPFNQLDFQTKTKISGHVRNYLKKNNISAIMVTHNGVEAMEWADKIIYMEKGRIKRIDKPQSFFENPSSKKEAGFFGELNKLRIKGKEIFFRPSFFSSEKTAHFKNALNVSFKQRQNLGWYSIFTFAYEDQEFRLFSTEDISNLTEIYIRGIQFND